MTKGLSFLVCLASVPPSAKGSPYVHAQQEWVDRGRGMLTVRASSQENSGTSPPAQVVFTMDSGRVLVNGAVYKGMSITKACHVPMLPAIAASACVPMPGRWPEGWCLFTCVASVNR